ncbi:hypothetical protein GCM10023315_11330 [Algibacter aquimarinus]|uniref:Concanavalin A-like lectin/glucanases superfamily protein n=2 Tax=Algibacter aquimarinus TaxID=1136748 RepID=A0ABP9H8Y3_9FLAO
MMKKMFKNLKKAALVLPMIMVLFAVSCANDDDATGQNFDIAQLEARIAEAENLIATGVEGINAGDFQPGSIQSLQDVVNWIYKRIESSKDQADIDDAVLKINAAIDKFLVSLVSEAFPWVKSENGAGIQFSDNIKELYFSDVTVEFQVYIVDINPSGCCANLISSVDPGANGLGVRYFGDGQVEMYAGIGGSWPEGEAPSGTLVPGEWINIALTSNQSTNKLYVNGQLVATLEAVPAFPNLPLILGNSPAFIERVSNALYKEFRVWNSVLDASTIQSNIGASFDGSESGLEVYFPLGSNLGSSFTDISGDYTATINGSVEWVSEPPVILLDYTNLNAAIQQITDFRATVVEGDMDGDYPVGTLDYIDELLANANDIKDNDGRQAVLDSTADALRDSIDLINANLVAPSDGVYIDSEDPSAVGLRITPNYTPQGDYTYEFEVRLKTLNFTTNPPIGDIMGNGNIGFRVDGYAELTEENVLNSGGGWNWTNVEGFGYIGPMYPAGTLKSGMWQHVAIVHDNTAMTTSIYVDGDMVGQSTDIGVPAVSGWAEIWLGNSFGFKMNGDIKDFRIWDEVRSVGQFDTDIDGSETNLQVYFPLDKVKGIKFADETGNYAGEMRGVIWNK